jgi:hypothetical protein
MKAPEHSPDDDLTFSKRLRRKKVKTSIQGEINRHQPRTVGFEEKKGECAPHTTGRAPTSRGRLSKAPILQSNDLP